MGVGKTYLIEISDSTNQARAIGVLSMAHGIGAITGPIIGGTLFFK
jgi:fucose permease